MKYCALALTLLATCPLVSMNGSETEFKSARRAHTANCSAAFQMLETFLGTRRSKTELLADAIEQKSVCAVKRCLAMDTPVSEEHVELAEKSVFTPSSSPQDVFFLDMNDTVFGTKQPKVDVADRIYSLVSAARENYVSQQAEQQRLDDSRIYRLQWESRVSSNQRS